jgi:dihydrofolate reductase
MSKTQHSISIIAAIAANGVIGQNGILPWYLPLDLKYFKEVTLGSRIIMGRRTWKSFLKPLPNREHIVVSSSKLELPDKVIQVSTFSSALAIPLPENKSVFVIGGSALYNEAIPLASNLYLTEIEANVDGDTKFPEWNRDEFKEISREHHEGTLVSLGPLVHYSFVHYARKNE